MNERKKLLAVVSHPDDESMGLGGILARYAAEGVETYLVTATRGERGWFGPEQEYPGAEVLGEIRQGELDKAAQVLGLREVNLLGYMDGELDRANPDELIRRIAGHIRRIRPQVVVTFDPNGYYGHPDHIAISQATLSAIVSAASAGFDGISSLGSHRVDKFYYLAATARVQEIYQQAFGDLVMNIDGVERRAAPWASWAITTRVDTSAYWETVWQAIAQHCSQLPGYQSLLNLSPEYHQSLWGEQTFYRAFSLVNVSRDIETDLFEGLEERYLEPFEERLGNVPSVKLV